MLFCWISKPFILQNAARLSNENMQALIRWRIDQIRLDIAPKISDPLFPLPFSCFLPWPCLRLHMQKGKQLGGHGRTCPSPRYIHLRGTCWCEPLLAVLWKAKCWEHPRVCTCAGHLTPEMGTEQTHNKKTTSAMRNCRQRCTFEYGVVPSPLQVEIMNKSAGRISCDFKKHICMLSVLAFVKPSTVIY